MSTHDDRSAGGGGLSDDRRRPGQPGRTQRVQPAGRAAEPPTQAVPAGAGAAGGGARHASSPSGPDGSGFDLYDDAYSDDYGDHGYDSLSEEFFDDEFGDGRKRFAWNAGTDLGLLVLRLVLGGVFVAHGAQKLFGVLGGPGPEGFAQALQKMGFEQSAALSLVTGATELGGGALLIFGLFTPLAAAGLLGVMANAVALRVDNGFFASQGGVEYEIVLGALALGLLFTGPGRVALDKGRSWFRRPLISGFIGLVIAAGAAVSVLLVLR